MRKKALRWVDRQRMVFQKNRPASGAAGIQCLGPRSGGPVWLTQNGLSGSLFSSGHVPVGRDTEQSTWLGGGRAKRWGPQGPVTLPVSSPW